VTYNPNIPQTGTRIDQTYNLITTNFGQLNSIFGFDNYTWNDSSVPNRGFSKKVTLVSQGTPPTPSATAGIAFTQNNPGTNITRIDPYYQFDTGALGAGLTAPLVPFKVFGTFTTAATGVVTNSFNIASVTSTFASNTLTSLVTFSNRLNNSVAGTSLVYVVFLSQKGISRDVSTQPVGLSYSSTTNSSLQVISTNVFGLSSGASISVGVIQY
jgi:hypothetical protein